jgi:asparagine synthase (glutamine-hydrolysing)
MCGIAGFVGTGGREDLRAMNEAQAHRGPDADGQWIDPDLPVHLGHRRLSILDLAGGAQPMWSTDGQLGIVFNGEIYNFAQLRAELDALGARFTTDHSDTEVLLHAYRSWGDDFVQRLNGMWAFVIWDRRRRRLFGSRDRFGKKPLYYLDRPDLFAFASELSSLTAHRAVRPSISTLAVKKYFAYGYIPAPHSIYAGVHKLPGGHSFEYDVAARRLRTWRFWDFVLEPQDDPTGPAQVEHWCDELCELLRLAVERRLVSDVPIGAFISGGIDSSAVAAYASRALGPGKLNTYSIGFREPTFDESAHARRAAAHVQSRHHERVLSIDLARELAPHVLGRLDEPMADSSIIPTYLLSEFAREQVTVALGGDGADELFAGYDPFRALRWARLYSNLVPKPLHHAIALAASHLPVSHSNMSLDFKIKRTLQGLEFAPRLWCPAWMAPVAPRDLEECVGSKVDLEEIYSEAIQLWDEDGSKSQVDKALRFYTKLYLQDDILCKVDRASMMHSLEVRAPFLDIDLVNFVRRLPASVKLRGGETKWILKKALARVLPDDIIHRSKKGFGMPIGEWFRAGTLSVPSGAADMVSPSFMLERLDSHKLTRSDERMFLWGISTLNYFSSRALPGASNAPVAGART